MHSSLALPMSALELCSAVRHARPYDSARLDRMLRLDAERGLVEVQARATWSALQAYLRRGAWEGEGTIADSIARNDPGPDGRPMVAHIEALTLVTPDGELRRISRQAHAELFALAVGGQGLIGAPYSATLRLDSLAKAAKEHAPHATLDLPRSGAPTRAIELLLPPQRAEQFVAQARSRCSEWRVAIEAAQVRRSLPEAETFLRWAREEYAAVTLALAQPPALGAAVRGTQLCRELIDCAIEQGGSFPIASTPEATRAQTEACYPQLRSFLAEKRRLDPAERLHNAWYRHQRSLLGRERCEGRWAN